MLRSKTGTATFHITKPDGSKVMRDPKVDMTNKQYRTMSTHPDMIWQYCQFLKEEYTDSCHIKAYVNVSLNFRRPQPLIDPNYDMAQAEWHLFQHEEWITDGPGWEDE